MSDQNTPELAALTEKLVELERLDPAQVKVVDTLVAWRLKQARSVVLNNPGVRARFTLIRDLFRQLLDSPTLETQSIGESVRSFRQVQAEAGARRSTICGVCGAIVTLDKDAGGAR